MANNSKAPQATSQAMGEVSARTRAHPTNFLAADPAAKHALVRDLFKSWDLAPSGCSEPLEVIEEQVVITEVYRVPFFLSFSIPRSGLLCFSLWLTSINYIIGSCLGDKSRVRAS